VAGGSKLNNVLMFLHMRVAPYVIDNRARAVVLRIRPPNLVVCGE
jgi:hypothetical protein